MVRWASWELLLLDVGWRADERSCSDGQDGGAAERVAVSPSLFIR